ncbi:hypothetical protein [Mesorhizobium sp. IMUNJ 23232]|uniref:hypothetical protein n=1 Tax=Mesorhizobium sp. IMUNJ 23232 TaxID=3376064 RepID=UPI00379D8992
MADEKHDKAHGKAERAARLARELRANLVRRKQQTRSREAEGEFLASADRGASAEPPAEADE